MNEKFTRNDNQITKVYNIKNQLLPKEKDRQPGAVHKCGCLHTGQPRYTSSITEIVNKQK